MRILMDHYAWADDPTLDLTWCVSVTVGSSQVAVVRAFGGDPGEARHMTFTEAEADAGDHLGEYSNLLVLCQNHHVVTIDGYGYSGTVPETARRVSANGGRFFAFHVDMNGNGRIIQAENGTVSAFLEPLFVNDRDISHPWRPAWVEAMRFPAEHLQAACLTALEEQTGLMFDRRWLTTALPTYRVPDPDLLFQDVPRARTP
jgi:Family of unknown function (DUF6461)